MPKVSDAHRASRREQILDAALRRFVAEGFHRTSMADIIAESGLSAGAIYGHFASKQEIAVGVARRVLSGRLDELDELAAHGPAPSPVDVLRRLLAAVTREMTDTRVIVQLWGEAVADPEMKTLVDGLFHSLGIRFGSHLARWAAQEHGLDAASARAWADRNAPLMIGLGQGYLIQRALLPDFDGDAYLARADELLR